MTERTRANLIPLIVALGAVCLAILLGPGADSASAKSEIFGFKSVPSTTQAGGHPDVFTTFELGSRLNQPQVPCDCNDPRDIIQHIPAGVIANPHVVSECRIAELALFQCPADSQAGVVVVQLFSFAILPLYRTPPQPGQAGLFAFSLPFGAAVPQYLAFSARTGTDYGLDSETFGISHILPLLYYAPIFWGVPGDSFNDRMRFAPGENAIECSANPVPSMEIYDSKALGEICPAVVSHSVPSSLPVAPMMQNPTTCAGPMASTMEVIAYDNERDSAEAPWPATTGCDGLSFDPSLAANPTTTNTDTASGLEVAIKVPQFQDPKVPSPSELKANTVTLPEGFSINPNAADGKTSCSDAQSAIGTKAEAQCPEHSKVGTVKIDSSALPAPIHGFIYLGEPKPGEPYRLVLTANGFGTAVKLLGTVHADPDTGKLVTSFQNLPQTPFQEFVLHFFGSERGLLATPTQCGTYPVESTFVPWASELSEQTQTQFFVLDHGPNGAPCPAAARDFSPSFVAGSNDNTAGKHSSFGLRISREDGDQNLSGLTLEAPPGFLAKLKGVQYCPEASIAQLRDPALSGRAELASPTCPAASQIGTATSGVGAGTHPLYSPGNVYLAGPHAGAPLSLVVVVPAVAGPYDLGNVAVRVALHVDPVTTEITAVSDPLPRILDGVPLRLRTIQVQLNRPGFVLNPTNCDPFAVGATITGNQGGSATIAAPFQVANCRGLKYEPELRLKLSGGLGRLGHPAIKAIFRARPGEANTRRVSVALPPGELLDNSHIGEVCRRAAFANDSCPEGSRIGSARATTPLLDGPLAGDVYLRTDPGRSLPQIALDLEGQIDVELFGRIGTTRQDALRTTIVAPDAPVSSVVIRFEGGKKGLIRNSTSLCGAKRKKARTRLIGQNGWVVNRKVRLEVSCGGKKRKARHTRRAGR